MTNQAHSYSIWINPIVINRGSVVHVSSSTGGDGWCVPVIGFTNASLIVAQTWNGGAVTVTGPLATANVWTHIAVTYSPSLGLRLFINGTQYGSATGPVIYAAASMPVAVTFGSSLNGTVGCTSGGIAKGQYYGYLDQFSVYSRELSASDVLALANP